MLARLYARFLCALGKPLGVALATVKVYKLGVSAHHKAGFPLACVIEAAALNLRVCSDKGKNLYVREGIVTCAISS